MSYSPELKLLKIKIQVLQVPMSTITSKAHSQKYSNRGNSSSKTCQNHASKLLLYCRITECIRRMTEVAYVEKNQEVRATRTECEQQTDLPAGLWGLERTTLRDWNRNNVYSYDSKSKLKIILCLKLNMYTVGLISVECTVSLVSLQPGNIMSPIFLSNHFLCSEHCH